jgi:2-iminobutanoate/2-iminopropanoate deaminase
MKCIATKDAPVAGGHYSQAVVANGFVFVAGQLPFAPGPEKVMPSGIEAQTRQVVANLRAILVAAGADLHDVVATNVYVSDIALWPQVDRVYAESFGSCRPARTVVPTAPLHYGALIELSATAAIRR